MSALLLTQSPRKFDLRGKEFCGVQSSQKALHGFSFFQRTIVHGSQSPSICVITASTNSAAEKRPIRRQHKGSHQRQSIYSRDLQSRTNPSSRLHQAAWTHNGPSTKTPVGQLSDNQRPPSRLVRTPQASHCRGACASRATISPPVPPQSRLYVIYMARTAGAQRLNAELNQPSDTSRQANLQQHCLLLQGPSKRCIGVST